MTQQEADLNRCKAEIAKLKELGTESAERIRNLESLLDEADISLMKAKAELSSYITSTETRINELIRENMSLRVQKTALIVAVDVLAAKIVLTK
jgi:chromosome segregation ATPase